MRVTIIVDMEGATGITRPEQLVPGTRAWERARVDLTQDVNAAIRGAVAGGATQVQVRDSHAYGFNCLVDNLEPDAVYLGGHFAGPVPVFGHLGDHDLAFYLAGHARSGTPNSFEPHTLRHRFTDLRINGKSVCEVELFGALLGAHGIRMGLITGEQVAVEQAAESLPWIIQVAVTKDPAVYETYGALLGSRIRERIFRGAVEAVERGPRMPLFVYEPPITIEARYQDAASADRENRWGFQQQGDTVILEGERYEDVFVDLLRLAYFNPTTWRANRMLLTLVRWYQGLKAGCLP